MWFPWWRKRPLDGAPGPSPWYLVDRSARDRAPTPSGFQWRAAGDTHASAGAMVLEGARGPVLIVDRYTVVRALSADRLLIWHQRQSSEGATEPVILRVLEPRALQPLGDDLETLCGAMRARKEPMGFEGPLLCETRLSTRTVSAPVPMDVPEALAGWDEFLILCHSSGIEPAAAPTWDNVAVMAVHPSKGVYQLYPQDWFNQAGLDYGYQWITRVARDARTGRIHGEGFRIAPFVLDETLRGVKRQWLRRP